MSQPRGSRLKLAASATALAGMTSGRKAAARASRRQVAPSLARQIHSSRLGGTQTRFHHSSGNAKGFVAAHEGYAGFVQSSVRRIEAEDSSPSGQLCAAALQGDTAAIARLVTLGGNVNWNAKLRMSPLQLAIQGHQLEAAEEILRHNADPRFVAAGARGWEASALHTACQNDMTEDGRFVHLLLQWGAAPLLCAPSYDSIYAFDDVEAQVRGGGALKCALRTAAELRPTGALAALQRYGWMKCAYVELSCAATGSVGWKSWWTETSCVTTVAAGSAREPVSTKRHPPADSLEALEAGVAASAAAKEAAREALDASPRLRLYYFTRSEHGFSATGMYLLQRGSARCVEHPIDYVAAVNLREKRRGRVVTKATIEVDFLQHTRLEHAAESAAAGVVKFAVAAGSAIGRAKERIAATLAAATSPTKGTSSSSELDVGKAAALYPTLSLRVKPENVDAWMEWLGERSAEAPVDPAVAAAAAAAVEAAAARTAEKQRLGVGGDAKKASLADKAKEKAKGAAKAGKRSMLGTFSLIKNAVGRKLKEAREAKANAAAALSKSALGVEDDADEEDEDSDTYIGGGSELSDSDYEENERDEVIEAAASNRAGVSIARAAARSAARHHHAAAGAECAVVAHAGPLLDGEGFIDRRPRAPSPIAVPKSEAAAVDAKRTTFSVHCDASGNTFYVNVVTGESSWFLPDDAVVGLSTAPKEEAQHVHLRHENNGADALRAANKAEARAKHEDALECGGAEPSGAGKAAASSRKCGACLFEIEDARSQFCANCGVSLVAAAAAAAAAAATAAAAVTAAVATKAARVSEPVTAGPSEEEIERQKARDDPNSTLRTLSRRFPSVALDEVERIYYDDALEQAGPAAATLRKLARTGTGTGTGAGTGTTLPSSKAQAKPEAMLVPTRTVAVEVKAKANATAIVPRRTGFSDFAPAADASSVAAEIRRTIKLPKKVKAGSKAKKESERAPKAAAATGEERKAAARELRALRKQANKKRKKKKGGQKMSAAMLIAQKKAANQQKAAATANVVSRDPGVSAVASFFDDEPMAAE